MIRILVVTVVICLFFDAQLKMIKAVGLRDMLKNYKAAFIIFGFFYLIYKYVS